MTVTKVEVRRLFTYGQFKNITFGYTAEVDDERPEEVKANLLNMIETDWTEFIGSENRIRDERRAEEQFKYAVADKERQIENLSKRIEKMREFLKQHGVEVPEYSDDLPF